MLTIGDINKIIGELKFACKVYLLAGSSDNADRLKPLFRCLADERASLMAQMVCTDQVYAKEVDGAVRYFHNLEEITKEEYDLVIAQVVAIQESDARDPLPFIPRRRSNS